MACFGVVVGSSRYSSSSFSHNIILCCILFRERGIEAIHTTTSWNPTIIFRAEESGMFRVEMFWFCCCNSTISVASDPINFASSKPRRFTKEILQTNFEYDEKSTHFNNYLVVSRLYVRVFCVCAIKKSITICEQKSLTSRGRAHRTNNEWDIPLSKTDTIFCVVCTGQPSWVNGEHFQTKREERASEIAILKE